MSKLDRFLLNERSVFDDLDGGFVSDVAPVQISLDEWYIRVKCVVYAASNLYMRFGRRDYPMDKTVFYTLLKANILKAHEGSHKPHLGYIKRLCIRMCKRRSSLVNYQRADDGIILDFKSLTRLRNYVRVVPKRRRLSAATRLRLRGN